MLERALLKKDKNRMFKEDIILLLLFTIFFFEKSYLKKNYSRN